VPPILRVDASRLNEMRKVALPPGERDRVAEEPGAAAAAAVGDGAALVGLTPAGAVRTVTAFVAGGRDAAEVKEGGRSTELGP
jgi:hypothetical protein